MNIKQAVVSLQNKLGSLTCREIQEELDIITKEIAVRKEPLIISHKDWEANGQPTTEEYAAILKDEHSRIPTESIVDAKANSVFFEQKEKDQPELGLLAKARKKRGSMSAGVVLDTLRYAKRNHYRALTQHERIKFDKHVKRHLFGNRNTDVVLQTVTNMLKGKTHNKIYKEVMND